MEQSPGAIASSTNVRRHWVIAGTILVVLSCVLGAWILVRGNHPFAVDEWWNTLWAAAPGEVLLAVSLTLDHVGGGWIGVYVVPLGAALLLFLFRRRWSAVYFLAASVASAAGVQILKHLFGRARPEDILILSDFGSYPSGHAANAATIAMIAALLFPKVWVYIVGGVWVVLMAFSRTFLHAHWASDTLGGALMGTGAALLVAAAFAPLLLRERADAASRTVSVAESS